MKARTAAACLKSALADLPLVQRPVDVTDEQAFPNIAEAVRHAASLTPERRKELGA